MKNRRQITPGQAKSPGSCNRHGKRRNLRAWLIVALGLTISGCKQQATPSHESGPATMGSSSPKPSPKPDTKPSPKPDTKPQPQLAFPNRFDMTTKKARKQRLPRVAFSLSYPDGLQVVRPTRGGRSINYFELLAKTKDGILQETLTIGSARNLASVHAKGHAGKMARGVWRKIIDDFARTMKRSYPKGKVAVKDGAWFGIRGPQMQATFHVKDPQQKLDHDLLMLVLCVPPSPGSASPNGVMLFMQAVVGNSKVKSFADFERKGMPAQVYRTFRFASAK